MKQYIMIAAVLLLVACTPIKTETPKAKANISITQILDEFDSLDAQYNTTWRQEEIPKKMIKTEALRAWTANTFALRNATENNTLEYELITARLDMLSAQTAFYLGMEVGIKGEVLFEQQGENFTAGKVNCTNVKEIAKETKLYQIAFHNWQDFGDHMDIVLQKSIEARQRIGVDTNRMAFYTAPFQKAIKKLDATVNAVRDQCGFAIKLEPEREMPPIPQSAVVRT